MPEAQRDEIDWEERTMGAGAVSNTMLALRSVLPVKALDYMYPQGLVHWDNVVGDIFGQDELSVLWSDLLHNINSIHELLSILQQKLKTVDTSTIVVQNAYIFISPFIGWSQCQI